VGEKTSVLFFKACLFFLAERGTTGGKEACQKELKTTRVSFGKLLCAVGVGSALELGRSLASASGLPSAVARAREGWRRRTPRHRGGRLRDGRAWEVRREGRTPTLGGGLPREGAGGSAVSASEASAGSVVSVWLVSWFLLLRMRGESISMCDGSQINASATNFLFIKKTLSC